MRNRIALFAVSIGLALVASISADDNVRTVQEKLRDEGFYIGEIDGAYSAALTAALSRYQIVKGLPISGQLDPETAKALGAQPAVASSNDQARISETWHGLRKSEWAALARLHAHATRAPTPDVTPSETITDNKATRTWPHAQPVESSPQKSPSSSGAIPSDTETPESPVASSPSPAVKLNETITDNEATVTWSGTQAVESSPQESPPSSVAIASDSGEPASPPPPPVASSPAPDFSTERLRDYVGAFVLAGLDPQVGAEAAFFADRVQYYNEGTKDRKKIRNDLQRYDARWPQRQFRLAGEIKVEPQSHDRVRVTFPLRYELRNGTKHSSGKVDKTLVLERAGDDLQIVAVTERKASDS